jgi:hypothetical protein
VISLSPVTLALDRLRKACARLDQGRFEEALALIGEDPDSAAAESVSLVARGMLHEREGAAAEADWCFERAFSLGVPLPALLHQCGRYFKRRGNYERAYQCFALLQNFRQDALKEFQSELPPPDLAQYAPWVVNDLVAGTRPHHWFYPPVKKALIQRFGHAGALAFAEMAGNTFGDIRTLPVASLRDFARSNGLVYEQLVPNRTVVLPAPPVFGGTDLEPFETRTRAVVFCVLEDVVVSSKSNFLIAGGRALLDYQDDELERAPLDLYVDPIVFGADRGSVTVMVEGGAVSAPPLERAFPLVGVNSRNFGHWLIEFLPKVWATLERPGFDSVPILIDEQLHPELRPALEFFVGRGHPIIVLKRGQAVRVKQLWTCTAVTYFPFSGAAGRPDVQTIDGEAFADLIGKLQPKLVTLDRASGPKRIYLSRKVSQHRRLVNRQEVEGWFSTQGFEILDPGDRTITEQLRLARAADVIVGPDGSALWITFLAPAGKRIGYLNSPHLENHRWIALASRSLGHNLSILTGEVAREHPDPTKSDYRIDIGALPPFLDQLLAR